MGLKKWQRKSLFKKPKRHLKQQMKQIRYKSLKFRPKYKKKIFHKNKRLVTLHSAKLQANYFISHRIGNIKLGIVKMNKTSCQDKQNSVELVNSYNLCKSNNSSQILQAIPKKEQENKSKIIDLSPCKKKLRDYTVVSNQLIVVIFWCKNCHDKMYYQLSHLLFSKSAKAFKNNNQFRA